MENSFEYHGGYWYSNPEERTAVPKVSKLIPTPYNQVLETACCRQIFILMTGRKSVVNFKC